MLLFYFSLSPLCFIYLFIFLNFGILIFRGRFSGSSIFGSKILTIKEGNFLGVFKKYIDHGKWKKGIVVL
jgi:hypothetical protein